MRAAVWLLGLFAVASAITLFAGNNQGVVSLFWPPYRIDLSVNLLLIALAALFLALHVALRGLSFFVALPREAGRWRQQRREQALFGAFLDALAQLQAGRFGRARKLTETAIGLQDAWDVHSERPQHMAQLRVLTHLLAAESLQALQERGARDEHLQALLALRTARPDAGLAAALEGAQIRAARWSLDDRDAQGALRRLDELPQGAARRILALRVRLKAARLAGQTALALETTRSLIRHRGFSEAVAGSLVRGLAIELIRSARDAGQLRQVWKTLEPAERDTPELAVLLGQRMLAQGGEHALARQWLEPAWRRLLQAPHGVDAALRLELVRALADVDDASDPQWLAQAEAAQQAQPQDAALQYLAGTACMKRQLWGKAQQHLHKAAPQLPDGQLKRRAWMALAELAEQRADADACLYAWQQAAKAGAV